MAACFFAPKEEWISSFEMRSAFLIFGIVQRTSSLSIEFYTKIYITVIIINIIFFFRIFLSFKELEELKNVYKKYYTRKIIPIILTTLDQEIHFENIKKTKNYSSDNSSENFEVIYEAKENFLHHICHAILKE